jgi:hypothetical protein
MEHIEIYESDLEKIIMESDTFALRKKGLDICESKKNQVKIPGYGIADIVGVRRIRNPYSHCESILQITVYELKKDKVGISAFFQAVGYCRGVQSFFQSRGFNYPISLKICLIGKEVDTTGSLVYLQSLLNRGSSIPLDEDICLTEIEFYRYSYGIAGVEFDIIGDLVPWGDKF